MILEKLKAVFYRPNFFQERNFNAGASFKFYSLTLLFVVGVTLLTLLPGFLQIVDSIRSGEWQGQKRLIEQLYPADLVLTLDQSTLSTNATEPVSVPFPQEWRQIECPSGHNCEATMFPKNLLVIDTTIAVSPQAIAERDTFVLLGQSEMGVHNLERGETRIFNFRQANIDEKVIVTKAVFDRWVGMGSEFLQTLFYIAAAFFPFILYLGLWIGYLIYSLFGAFVVWLAGHIRGQSLTYGQAFLAALYLLPAPFVVTFLMETVGIRIPFAFTLILFVAALVNFPKLEKSSGSTPVAPVLPPKTDGEDKPAAATDEPKVVSDSADDGLAKSDK